jgi:hypothetical protein
VGLNLSCGVNESSFTENCFGWMVKFKVDTVRFVLSTLPQPGWINAYDGQVELRFEGRGLHKERLKRAAGEYPLSKIFGQFSGVLRPIGRPEVRIDNPGALSKTSM